MNAYAADDDLLALYKDELTSTLQQVQHHLDDYLKNRTDVAALEALIVSVDQLNEAFKILQQPQPAQLTEEIVAIAHQMVNGTVERSNEVHGALLRATLYLPRYVQYLVQGNGATLDLLSVINQLRGLRGVIPLSAEAVAPTAVPASLPADPATDPEADIDRELADFGTPRGLTRLFTPPSAHQPSPVASPAANPVPPQPAVSVAPTPSPSLTPAPTPGSVAPPPAPVEPEIDPEFVEIFFEEARGELETIRENLPVWRENLADRDALTAIRRSFHTLKGSGRMVGQTAIGDFAWSFESLLNRVLDNTIPGTSAVADAVEAAQALIGRLVGESEPDGSEPTLMKTLSERAQTLLDHQGQLTGDETPVVSARAAPALPVETAPPQPSEAPARVEVQGGESTEAQEAPTPASPTQHEPLSPPSAAEAVSRLPIAPPSDVDPELIAIFLHEAAEILDNSDTLLEQWKNGTATEDTLNDLRREMHTLKGSSRMAGFMDIGNLAHAMESILNTLSTDPSAHVGVRAHVDALQRALDRLNVMIGAARNNQPIEPAQDLIDQLKGLLNNPPAAPATKETAAEVMAPPAVAEPAAPVDSGASAGGNQLTELDHELVQAFQYEAVEILDASDAILQRWNADPSNLEILNELRRNMHTLKGSSRMVGLMNVGNLAHAMESLLDGISKGTLKPDKEVVEGLQRALDRLNDMIGKVKSGVNIAAADDLIGELRGLLAGEAPRKTVAVTPTEVKPTAKTAEPAKLEPVVEDTIRVSAVLLNKLVNEMGESSIYRARIDQGVGALRFNLSELSQTVTRLRQQLRRMEIETEAQIVHRYEHRRGDEEFDPLEMDRFSELQQLSRSLMEIVDDLTNIQATLDDHAQEMGFLLDQQGKVNKEIQQGLMRTRMVRFDSVAPRLRRVVRQAAQDVGKKAELVIEGLEAEVDRTILENMVAPLEHMLRNSISHGIEMPEERRAQGKPEQGVITLSMRREGAEIVLLLHDDGAGLNFDAIRAKGEKMGLLKPNQPVTQDELIALLLRPGFSTAQKVTQISGRGVGMDVLNEAIKSMRGALLIQTERYKGTTFIIRLPFSLAVTQALLVKTGNDTYAVPLLSIQSVTRIEETEFKMYLAGESIEHKYRDHVYPMHSLGVLMGVESSIVPYEKVVDKRPPALLFRSAEASAALQVDAVLGNQEIIVKPLSPQFHSVTGISGATVLGDGRVVVVLELAALVRSLAHQAHKQAEAMALNVARQEEKRRDRIRVLVIDDSITMRKVTQRFLERHNMSVRTAKDGVDALSKLEEQVPDLVILDIEMPRMDGFEVAAHIRNQQALKHIPIIMVTSRGGDKHRARAAKLGVNEYLTKPYQEEQMIKAIRRLMRRDDLDMPISRLVIG